MKILVTGGCGFIGTALIKKLLDGREDISITSIDNYFSSTDANHIKDPRVKYYCCSTNNIFNFKPLEDLYPDITYHLGEYSRIVPSFEDINFCQSFNGTGTFCVLEYCREYKSKLVYSASSSKFGNNGQDENLSPYAWWKAKNVELIRNYHAWWDLDYSIAYFYNVYGPGQLNSGRMSTVIGRFQEQYLNNEPLTVVSPGTQTRDFTHIDDIVKGLALVGEKGHGDNYLLGTSKNYSLLEVAEAFNHPFVLIPERRGERLESTVLPSRARDELGWCTEYDVIDYIKSWIKEQKLYNK